MCRSFAIDNSARSANKSKKAGKGKAAGKKAATDSATDSRMFDDIVEHHVADFGKNLAKALASRFPSPADAIGRYKVRAAALLRCCCAAALLRY